MFFFHMDRASSEIYSIVPIIKELGVLGMEKFSYLQKPWANDIFKAILGLDNVLVWEIEL